MESIFNVNGISLDKYQRKAILYNGHSSLIIAGAGAGKSLTMVGKVRYLVEIKRINPEDILCITFTNKAANSLEQNINKNYNYNIKVYTFHKLALCFLKDENYSISPNNLLEYIVDEYFYMIENTNYNNIIRVKKVLNMIDTPYKIILKSSKLRILKNTIISFLRLFKTNNYSLENFISINNNKDLIRIIIDIYFLYEDELSSTNTIDFDDMLIKATKYIKHNTINNYKYIIVDEYQDTSYNRYLFLKAIIDKTDSKIVCVGDDYQSIYRFNGCDLTMFLNFKKYFKHSKIFKIKNTYRNSKELITVATDFIMKNNKQIYKKLYSNKTIYKPIKLVFDKSLEYALNLIKDKYKNILVLGRNNIDIENYTDSENIKYMTVHASKGLEADCVIVLNIVDDILGFPNKLEDDKIFTCVTRYKVEYPYDEERRLFYVALTRTKNEVFLMTNSKNTSIFIKELIKNSSKYIEYI